MTTYTHPAYAFNASFEREDNSDLIVSGKEKIRASVVNILQECANRFERSPGKTVLEAWSLDLVRMGYSAQSVKSVCSLIPMRFDKFPSFKDFIDLIKVEARAYDNNQSSAEIKSPERVKLEEHRDKLIGMFGKDKFEYFVKYYMKHVLGHDAFGEMDSSVFWIIAVDHWAFSGFGSTADVLRTKDAYFAYLEKKKGVKTTRSDHRDDF